MSIRYSERLAEAGIEPSVDSVGNSYDNALAETINGLYKGEVIHRQAWRNREQVELATLDWVHWYNHKRLPGPIGHPASRSRSGLLSATTRSGQGGLTQTKWPPRKPRRFKKVYRLYREANLAVRRRMKARRPSVERLALSAAASPNAVWCMDFVSEALANGRRLKCLTVAPCV